jgi:hypothetical protein
MRNIAEHPITKGEIVGCLEEYQRKIMDESGVGDIRPFCLSLAIKLVIATKDKDFAAMSLYPDLIV